MAESKIQFKIHHYGDKEKRFVVVKCKDLAKFGDVMKFCADQVCQLCAENFVFHH